MLYPSSDVHIIPSLSLFTWRQRRRRRSSSSSIVSGASCPHKVKPSELNGLWLTLGWGVRTKRFDDLHACNVQNLSKWVVLSFHSFCLGACSDPTLSARMIMWTRLNIGVVGLGHKNFGSNLTQHVSDIWSIMHAYQEWTCSIQVHLSEWEVLNRVRATATYVQYVSRQIKIGWRKVKTCHLGSAAWFWPSICVEFYEAYWKAQQKPTTCQRIV